MMKVFSIYDSKAEAYLPPFMFQQTGEAIRAFTDAVNDEKSNFCKHAEDYTLFQISEWNEQDGCYMQEQSKKSLGNALEYKNIQ
jgi:hypothetical protein